MIAIFAPLSPANVSIESAVVIGLRPPPSAVVTMENCDVTPVGGKVGVALDILTQKPSDGTAQACATAGTEQV
jgi:hypothetical protein